MGGIQRTGKFNEKRIASRLDFPASVVWKDGAKQLAVFLKQLQRQRLVLLRQGAVAHHIGEHDRHQLAMFSACAHGLYRRNLPGRPQATALGPLLSSVSILPSKRTNSTGLV